MELFVVLFLFGFVCAKDCRNNNDLRIIDSLYPETGCSSAGGQCTVAVDCPQGQLAPPGLCPQQQYKGIECCNGISVKETRCQKLGGECFSIAESNCRRNLIEDRAKNCDPGYVCCMLL